MTRLLIILCLFLFGCSKHLEPMSFRTSYEKGALQKKACGRFECAAMYMNADYLHAVAAISGNKVSPEEQASEGEYFKVSFRAPLSNTEENQASSPMSAFQSKIPPKVFLLMQFGISRYAYLENEAGQKIPAVGSHFEKGFGTAPQQSLVFAFPNEFNSKKIDVSRCEFVLEEFGLNTGSIRFPIQFPQRLKLKVKS